MLWRSALIAFMLPPFFWTLPRGKSYIHITDLLLAIFYSIFSKSPASFIKKFEVSFCKLHQSQKCLTFSSCRAALYFLLRCSDIKKGSEVLLTPITIPDIINAVIVAGYKPVFVDLDPDTQNIDIGDLKRKISKKTRIILITHLSGIVPNLRSLEVYLREKNLFIIEDISQNYLSEFGGTLTGTFGDAAVGSFCTTKTVCSMVGGVLLINNRKMMERFQKYERPEPLQYHNRIFIRLLLKEIQIQIVTNRLIFSLFTYPAFFMLELLFGDNFDKKSSLNFRARRKNLEKEPPFYENVPLLRKEMAKETEFSLNKFQGVLAYRTLLRAQKGQETRRHLASVLFSEFNDNVMSALPSSLVNVKENGYWHVPIYVDNKSKFRKFLFSRGIDVVGSTLQLCSQIEEFQDYRMQTDRAKYVFEHNIFLPIHDDYSVYDMKRVARAVNDYFTR